MSRYSNVRCWLQADLQSPEIEVRFTPKSRRSSGRPRESVVDPKPTPALSAEGWSHNDAN